MTKPSERIFVVGSPDDEPASRQRPTAQPVTRNHEAATLLRTPHAVAMPTEFSNGEWSDRYALAPGAATNVSAHRTTPLSLSTPTTPIAPMTHQPQTQQARDVEVLRELIATTVGNATFAMNTFDLPAAAKALREAAGFADRLVLLNAANVVGNTAFLGEFAGYDMNNPTGEKLDASGRPAASAHNAATPRGDEFDGYNINDL